jgi:integrase
MKAHKGKHAKAELAAKHWENEWKLVFTTAHGWPLEPSFVTHKFQEACAAAGLPVIRFHDLRHSFVSLLGDHGVDVAVVSKMIGHSSVTLTLNTYRHVFEKAQREAANAIDRVLAVE